MTVTSNTIANQALQMLGDNAGGPVSGQNPTFDTSTAGIALQNLYGPCVQTVGRQHGWDMARNTVTLTLSGNAAPFPWAYEYKYPTNGIQVWQVMPAGVVDANNPLPTNWIVANAIVAGQQQRVIQTTLVNALAVYNNNPNENTWDALFREAVVRLLVSELSIALFGKPDAAQGYLESGGAFESIGEARDS